jgi:hypothetical protein
LLGLEGIVSKKLDAPYKSGPSKVCQFRRNKVTPGELLKCPPSNDTGGTSWIGTELKETGNR